MPLALFSEIITKLMQLKNKIAIIYGANGAITGTTINVTCGSAID